MVKYYNYRKLDFNQLKSDIHILLSTKGTHRGQDMDFIQIIMTEHLAVVAFSTVTEPGSDWVVRRRRLVNDLLWR